MQGSSLLGPSWDPFSSDAVLGHFFPTPEKTTPGRTRRGTDRPAAGDEDDRGMEMFFSGQQVVSEVCEAGDLRGGTASGPPFRWDEGCGVLGILR